MKKIQNLRLKRRLACIDKHIKLKILIEKINIKKLNMASRNNKNKINIRDIYFYLDDLRHFLRDDLENAFRVMLNAYSTTYSIFLF